MHGRPSRRILARLIPAALVSTLAIIAPSLSRAEGPPPAAVQFAPAGSVILPPGASEITVHHPLDAAACAQLAATQPASTQAASIANHCDATFTLRREKLTMAQVLALVAKNGPPPGSGTGPTGPAVAPNVGSARPKGLRAR